MSSSDYWQGGWFDYPDKERALAVLSEHLLPGLTEQRTPTRKESAATSVLALRAITTGIGVTVQIQNASGSVVATGAGPGTFAFALPSAGTYFVRITSTSLGAYTVGVAN